MVLGIGEYQAFVVDNRDGDKVVADLTPHMLRGQWDRQIDEMSQAQVTLAASPDCCDLICQITVVRYDLVLLRDGQVVWQGPITRIRSERRTYQVRIIAQDVVWWLKKRVVPKDYDFTGNLGVYIETMITDAMAPDPRGMLQHLTILNGITDGSRAQDGGSQVVYNELRELARTVLDYTTVGKRLIIGPDLYELVEVAPLTDEHFLDGIEVFIDGEDYRNVSYVRHSQKQFVKAGQPDDFFGLVEGIVREFSIRDEASAKVAAEIDAAQGGYPPVLLFGEGGAILAPEAPVSTAELIPGVITAVSLSEICPPVSQQQRLLAVEVNFSKSDGEPPEAVGTRWGPIGATVNRRQDR